MDQCIMMQFTTTDRWGSIYNSYSTTSTCLALTFLMQAFGKLNNSVWSSYYCVQRYGGMDEGMMVEVARQFCTMGPILLVCWMVGW